MSFWCWGWWCETMLLVLRRQKWRHWICSKPRSAPDKNIKKKKKNIQIWVDVCVQLIFVEEFVYKFWNILGFYSFVLGIEYFGFVVLVCSWSRWIWNRNLIIWMWNLWVYGFTGDWLVCWIYFLFSWHWWRLDLVVGFVSWIWEECEEQIVVFLWKNNEK